MAFNQTTAELIAQQYTNLMLPVIQQGDSRTAPSTEFKTGLTVRDVQILDYMGKVVLRETTDLTSIRETAVDSVTAESRWLPAPHLVEHCIRKSAQFDLLTLVNQDSAVRQAQAAAYKRHMDKEFIRAALGPAITNINLVAENPGVTPAGILSPYSFVTLPEANIITVAEGTTLTAAIDQALAKFDGLDVDTSMYPVYAYIPSKAKALLFEDPRYDNWNNMGGQVLADGNLTPYRGVQFVRLSDEDVFKTAFDSQGTNTEAVDKIILVAGKAICTGIWSDFKTEISVLPEHSYAQQIYTCMSMASTRLDEQRVIVLDIEAL